MTAREAWARRVNEKKSAKDSRAKKTRRSTGGLRVVFWYHSPLRSFPYIMIHEIVYTTMMREICDVDHNGRCTRGVFAKGRVHCGASGSMPPPRNGATARGERSLLSTCNASIAIRAEARVGAAIRRLARATSLLFCCLLFAHSSRTPTKRLYTKPPSHWFVCS
jgi:hypothetical protein